MMQSHFEQQKLSSAAMADQRLCGTTSTVDSIASIRQEMMIPGMDTGGMPIGYRSIFNLPNNNDMMMRFLSLSLMRNERFCSRWLEDAAARRWVVTPNTSSPPTEIATSANGGIKPTFSENVSATRSSTNPVIHSNSVSSSSSILTKAKVAEQTSRKEKLGSYSTKLSIKWLASLEELKLYKKEHGDCIVPRGYAANPRLASWVAEQRKQYKLMTTGNQSSITVERIQILNDIGFAWNAQEEAWKRQIRDLKQFFQENGHCHVPLNHSKYPRLGLWVKEQRRHYTLLKQGKQSHMNDERIKALVDVGLCWDTHEAIWMERLKELHEFKEKYGSCLVPTGFAENPKLGTWVNHQRRQYKKFMKGGDDCHITKERIRALESIGFVWHPREGSTSAVRLSSSTWSTASTSTSSTNYARSASDDNFELQDLHPRKRRRSS